MTKPIVLPADVYDTLHFSALAYGGIGGGRAFDDDEDGTPRCLYGHLYAAADGGDGYATMVDQCDDLGLTSTTSDRACPPRGRISFAGWCKRLNVVRGA
jgi:hypothetical protein